MPTGPELRVSADPVAACADSIARRLRAAVRAGGRATMAVSGGSTAPALLAALAIMTVPWGSVGIWQVDERVAPDGDADRNAPQLGALGGHHYLMSVTDDDLLAAAARYGASLPERFDVVHLGMGDDGHTASWPPGDPVIDNPAPVALSRPYQGRVRMTLTPPVVNRAGGRVVLTTGAAKAGALSAWLRVGEGPIARLRPAGTVVFADAAAVGR